MKTIFLVEIHQSRSIFTLKADYFASNDLLLRELQTLYEQEDSSRDGKPDFFQSDLLGAGVAENIVQARIARMEKFIQQR